MTVNNNISNNNVFSLFPPYTLEQANADVKTHKVISSDKQKDTVDINNQNKKSNTKKILFGSTLASTILTAGILGLFFAKGFHGSSFKKLSKYTEHLSKRIQETSTSGTKDLFNKIVFFSRKGTKKTIDGLQSTSNFTALKDWIADKIFRTNKVTTKFADTSTRKFKKIVDKTLGKKYNKVGVQVNNLTSLLKHYNITNLSNLSEAQKMQKVTIKGQTLTLGEWINRLGQQTQRLETAFDNGFSLGAIRMRDKKRSSLLGNISEKIKERFFKDKKSLFNPKNYTTYVTEDVTSAAHNELRDELLKAKKEITNNIPSIHENIKSKLGSFSHDIKPDDEALRTISQSIKQKLEKFKSCSGSDEQKVRDKISKEISSLIDDAQVLLKDNLQYSPSEQAEMAAKLNSIKSSVLSTGQSSKGALEEIMTIIKGLNSASAGKNGAKIISDESYKELSKLSSKISKGLADAVKLEADEYFLKQAELKVGSAPTDVLSVLFPIGVSAYAIGKGEDKDDRISATLTTCIPLIGTFATFVYGTVKMYSGAKNLIFSFVTGAIISKLGNYCDKLYKKYKDSGSIVKVAKEEYNNFWTDLTPQYAETLKNKENK